MPLKKRSYYHWSSDSIRSLDPVWSEGNVVDILVFDRQQVVTIKLYDEDMVSDDYLGRVKDNPLPAMLTIRNACPSFEFIIIVIIILSVLKCQRA